MTFVREKSLRQIRTAGWAAVAYAVLQLLALPAVVWRADGHWTWAPTTALEILPTIVLAWFALRRSRLAALILGAYAVYRVSLFGLAVIRVLDGTAATTQWASAWVFGTVVALPFAIFWLRGGIAALRTIRDGDSSEATA
ncbi:MAG: hypothetical protein ACREND_12180 [Gemmatimonadaceae bacterium]